MVKEPPGPPKDNVYEVPLIYVWFFYAALVAWTVVCVVLIGSKALKSGWALGQLLMIAFVLAYTWYFSLGISYRIRVGAEGTIHLTSFRRIIEVKAAEIEMVEGPGLAIGFIRFRLAREKAYLFCSVRSRSFQRVLAAIKDSNPEIKLKKI